MKKLVALIILCLSAVSSNAQFRVQNFYCVCFGKIHYASDLGRRFFDLYSYDVRSTWFLLSKEVKSYTSRNNTFYWLFDKQGRPLRYKDSDECDIYYTYKTDAKTQNIIQLKSDTMYHWKGSAVWSKSKALLSRTSFVPSRNITYKDSMAYDNQNRVRLVDKYENDKLVKRDSFVYAANGSVSCYTFENGKPTLYYLYDQYGFISTKKEKVKGKWVTVNMNNKYAFFTDGEIKSITGRERKETFKTSKDIKKTQMVSSDSGECTYDKFGNVINRKFPSGKEWPVKLTYF